MLCYFEGLTLDEVSRRLHWPVGTVRSRLARARDKLRRGLARRGVVLPAAAIAAALSPKPAAASVSSVLCEPRQRPRSASSPDSPSRPPPPLSLGRCCDPCCFKVGLTTLTVLSLAAATIGAGFLGHSFAIDASPTGQAGSESGREGLRAARGDRHAKGSVVRAEASGSRRRQGGSNRGECASSLTVG